MPELDSRDPAPTSALPGRGPGSETRRTLLWALGALAVLQLLSIAFLSGSAPVEDREPGGTVLTGTAAWNAALAGGLVVLLLLLLGLSPAGSRWHYDVPGRRDLRVDMLRGVAVRTDRFGTNLLTILRYFRLIRLLCG